MTFFEQLPAWAGTLPNWITAGGVMTALGLLLKYNLGAKQIGVETAKVDDEAEAKLRESFAAQLERLSNQVAAADQRAANAQKEAEETKGRQRECENREERLRTRVRKLEDDLSGIIRAIAAEGSLRVLDLTGDDPSENVVKAAISALEKIIEAANRSKESQP